MAAPGNTTSLYCRAVSGYARQIPALNRKNKEMEILGKTPINPLLFITGKTSGYLTWIFFFFILIDVDFLPNHSNSTLRLIALIILFFGITLLILSSIYLGKSVRIGLPNTKTVLKKSGVYRISRNPMYLGFNLVTLSSMIYISNWIVIVLGVYSIIIYHLIILGEEKFLIAQFGEQYLKYKISVRRYL